MPLPGDAKSVDVPDIVAAVSQELSRSADRLRRVEGVLLRTLSARFGSRDALADVQSLDLVIQTIDDLAPLLQLVSEGLRSEAGVTPAELLESLRLDHLRDDLARLDAVPTRRETGHPELF